MGAMLPILRHAVLTDTGQRRLANEDAFFVDTRMNLYVVCDGLGGRPSGEAASQIIAHSISHLLRREIRKLKTLGPATLKRLMTDLAIDLSETLYDESGHYDVLTGMGATLLVFLVDGNFGYLLHAGDSRAFMLRGGKLHQLTEDHFRMGLPGEDPLYPMTTEQEEQRERRLITQFIGAKRPIEPNCQVFQLEAGDRILLSTDGLTDPVEHDVIEKVIGKHDDLQRAVRTLIDAANRCGGPDNITALIAEYHGVRPMTAADTKRPPATMPPNPLPGAASGFTQILQNLEKDLRWLRDGSRESTNPNRLHALAATKKRLGGDVYRHFLSMAPSDNPSHVFHRACVLSESGWRQRYENHQVELEPFLKAMCNGSVRLSPLLAADETSGILKALWEDWRRVEQRYFRVCHREAISEDEQTLDLLIEHMYQSVRTLIGLMEFFPQFMREDGKSDSQLGISL